MIGSCFIEKDIYKVNGDIFITHLIYADDIFFFTKTNKKLLNSIENILVFHRIYGDRGY